MHPRFEEWVALLEGTLDEAAHAVIQAHLREGCETCTRKEAEIAGLMRAIQQDRLLMPSNAARQVALNAQIPGQVPRSLPTWAVGLRETLASLVFDSFAEPRSAFAGARSASVARRLCYETGGVELDLLVESEGDVRRVTGQMLVLADPPRPLAHAQFVVLCGGEQDTEGSTNERGEFQHELRAPGEVEIRVAREGRLITFRIPEPFFDTPEN